MGLPEWFLRHGKTRKGRKVNGEGWADVRGHLATWGHGDGGEGQSEERGLLAIRGQGNVQIRLLPRALPGSLVLQ